MGSLTLILGGSNSGKSRFAESLIKNCQNVLYLATAEPLDEEMKKKVEKHRKSRPPEWITIEEPVHIDKVIEKEKANFSAILLECILLYLNNIIKNHSSLPEDEIEKIALDKITKAHEIIRNSEIDCYMISGEVGLGLIGETKSARLYARVLGKTNQLLPKNATNVFFVVAGIPMKIK